MQEFLEQFTYLGLVLILLLTGVGLPLPEDIPLLIAGYLCAQDLIRLEITIVLAMAAIVGSDCMLYYFGNHYGERVYQLPILKRMIKPELVARASNLYNRHGGKTLFAARFLPGLRAPLFFTAGMFRLGIFRLLAYDGLAALISVPLIVLAGWFFADQIEAVKDEAKRLRLTLLALSIVVVLSFALVYLIRRRRREEGTPPAAAGDPPPADD